MEGKTNFSRHLKQFISVISAHFFFFWGGGLFLRPRRACMREKYIQTVCSTFNCDTVHKQCGVRLSVCLSNADIVSKRMDTSSNFLTVY